MKTLQQILLFRELDFPLKEIKRIMTQKEYDQAEAFQKQKALLIKRRDRLDRLLSLLDKLEKGESCMEFEDFKLQSYLQLLEQFKAEHTEEIMQQWGSIAAFDDIIAHIREHEADIAKTAVEYYGSTAAYTDAMKYNLEHFSEIMEKLEHIRQQNYGKRNQQLMEKLLQDTTRDPASAQVQQIIYDMQHLIPEEEACGSNPGMHQQKLLIDSYLHNEALIQQTDQRYGRGASRFMGKALRIYFDKEDAAKKQR
ncbi:MAG: MerR family transcriptional regulator [Streptococcus sp.]